ncbi:MAG: acyl-CoA dehydrogenase family protein [Candidatus Tectomicrobia bacterium]|nr:acyl-CoA dehydrogenase family protein [Candidatus Tectomicrobia bacterium]
MSRRMDVYLEALATAEQFLFYRSVCDFAVQEIAPHLLGWERQRCLLPEKAVQAMADLGLFGLTVAEEYGGQGGRHTDLVLMGLALGYHSQSVAITPGAAASLGIKPLQLCGSEAQKRAHLPDLSAGRRMFVFGLSEPGRGSDAANPQVTASRVPGGWRLNGEKCWSTNARWASHAIVHAMTQPGKPRGHRSTCFIVPMDAPGVSYNEMGGKDVWLQSSTGAIALEGVEVADADMLGEEDEGFRVMAATLNGGRLYVAAIALASLAFALDACRSYAQERRQFDDLPIGRFQRVQDVLLDMDIALEQGLTWLMRCTAQYEAGVLNRESAAKIKIECSRRASELLPLAMEICGAVACLDEFGLTRHQRDMFVTRVGEGSNFALKTLAARPLMPGIADLLH